MAGSVVVSCKLPNGLILRVYGMVEHAEPVMGGGMRTVKRAVQLPGEVKINGCAAAMGKALPHDIRNGVGLTFGVDADLFNAWREQNKDSDFVKRELIYASAKPAEVEAQAKSNASVKSGFEPVDRNNLPEEFTRKGAKIESAFST